MVTDPGVFLDMGTLVWHYLVTLEHAYTLAAPRHADPRAHRALLGRELRKHIDKAILKYGGMELFMRTLGKYAALYPKINAELSVHPKIVE